MIKKKKKWERKRVIFFLKTKFDNFVACLTSCLVLVRANLHGSNKPRKIKNKVKKLSIIINYLSQFDRFIFYTR